MNLVGEWPMNSGVRTGVKSLTFFQLAVRSVAMGDAAGLSKVICECFLGNCAKGSSILFFFCKFCFKTGRA